MKSASNRLCAIIVLAAVVALLAFPLFAQKPGVTEKEARAIAVEAYLYFYPLVSMDITRRQLTNIEAGKEVGKGPMNFFVSFVEYPPADMKVVVRPNFDTLYSTAWLDLTQRTGGRVGARHGRALLLVADARHVD